MVIKRREMVDTKNYHYKGPVLEFGRCIENNWTGSTKAPSEKKARSNLAYQYKTCTGRIPASKIDLPGVIVVED